MNSSAGARLPAAETEELKGAAAAAGIEVLVLDHQLDVAAAVRQRIREGARLFIAAGGDGTVNHVVQALVHSEGVLAVLPIGTYNHFARDVGVPVSWRDALDVALNGSERQVDVARVNTRYFVNNLSIGLYPELVARREERGRDYPRWKARLYAAYMTLRSYPHVSLTIESEHHDEVVRTHVFIASNNSYDLSRAGIEAARPLLTEGRLKVYWLPHVPRVRLMKFAAHYLAGRVLREPGFRSISTRRVKIHSGRRELRVGLDGEVFTFETPLVLTSAPQSLLVKVPR